MLLYFTGDGLCSLEQVVDIDLYLGGGVQLFSFSFGLSFLSGVGSFLFGDFSFFCWSGGGAFFGGGDSFFFFPWGGGSPLIGENNAFMAEPSGRPAINDRLGGRKEGGCKYEKNKKNGKKKLNLIFQLGQNFSAQPGEVDTMI